MSEHFETDWCVVHVDNNAKVKEKVWNKLMQWFRANEAFTAEKIVQTDQTYIDAPYLLGEIAEMIFEVNNKE